MIRTDEQLWRRSVFTMRYEQSLSVQFWFVWVSKRVTSNQILETSPCGRFSILVVPPILIKHFLTLCPRRAPGSQNQKTNLYIYFFDVLLTVHLSIFISVINQLDAQNFCFTISLFHASTCFEHMCSSSGDHNCITQPLVIPEESKWHYTAIRRSKLHYTASGIPEAV